MMLFEKKNGGGIKDVDSKLGIVTGYLSSFGNIDADEDVIQKGAFSKTISERKNQIFFLFQHDWGKPLSKFKELIEDEKGLYFEAEISNTSYGKDLIQLYEDGVINEHSIGFNTLQSERRDDGIRLIKEVKLWEGSAVTLGANSNTPYTGRKSTIKEIHDQSKRIIKAVRNGDYTDDTFYLLEVALKQLQQEAYMLGKKDTKKDEPSPDTHNIIEPSEITNYFQTIKI